LIFCLFQSTTTKNKHQNARWHPSDSNQRQGIYIYNQIWGDNPKKRRKSTIKNSKYKAEMTRSKAREFAVSLNVAWNYVCTQLLGAKVSKTP